MLLLAAIAEGIGYEKGKEEMGMQFRFIDINRAYLQVDAKREIYVELPPEDGEEGMCAKLAKDMHGTRDAAQNWEHAYRKAHEEWVGKA